MAKSRTDELFSSLRAQGLRKRVAKALSDLPSGSELSSRAEKLARDAIKDLRGAADEIEKRLNIRGAGTRSRAAKKAAKTRRSAAKRSTAAKRGAAKKRAGAKKSTARKSTARKSTARKSTARKSTRRATKR